MPDLNHFRIRAVRIAYGATVALFLWVCAQFYIPGEGFTYLVMFGGKNDARALPELHAVDHFIMSDSVGYDGQFYAQIAMHPRLGDRAIKKAVDNLPYRARRILFSWTAYAFALGDPVRALHVYSLQNIICWLLLAALLLRWFPATSFDHYLRWAGVLLCFGLCASVRGSLLDGPSLLLIAVAMALAEARRPWLATAVLGLSGLGKETNVLAGAIFAPDSPRPGRDWLRAVLRWALIVAPVVLWMLVLHQWIGSGANAGARNFDWPLAGYVHRWQAAIADLCSSQVRVGAWSLLVLTALSAQWLFFALRPRWESPWWRLGAAYATLMAFLGDAVWEGFPGAASRVLLPMALAFNILVPRSGKRWFLLLVLGNLTMLLTPLMVDPPQPDSVSIEGPRALRTTADGGRSVRVAFDEHWLPPEKSLLEHWRWSTGPASIAVWNPQPFATQVDLAFRLRAKDARRVTVRAAGSALTEVALRPGEPVDVHVRAVPLPPGRSVVTFDTDAPPLGDARRPIAFSVRNLTLTLVTREAAEVAK